MLKTSFAGLVAAAIALCLTGCLGEENEITFTTPTDGVMTKRDSLIANAYIVRDAAEVFAAANGGVYAFNLSDPLPDGRTLIDLLPDGQLLVNPYSGVRDSPDNTLAAVEGRVGYVPARPTVPYGYIVTAMGPDYEQVINLSVDPDDL